MTSIRGRLLIILLVATGAIWLSAVLWIQHSTRQEVIHVLDRRLEESARMVASLIGDGMSVEDARRAVTSELAPQDHYGLRRQLSCQIWGLDGTLIGESEGAPEGRLAEGAAGFSENTVEGEVWRVYTLVEPDAGFRVMVGDAQAMRDHLVQGVTLSLLVPMSLMLPVLAGLIWLIVGRGLTPLDRLGATLSARAARDLSPIDDTRAPRELRPMVAALNGLLRRVGRARERERNFTAFAAHELKTPLAGLQTQAEIASMAPDEATRARALEQISQGVKRTDRMVKQLLDMAAIEQGGSAPDTAPHDGAGVLAAVAEDLAPLAERRGVSLRLEAPEGLWPTCHATLLQAALRNLVENAVQASPEGAEVEAGLRRDGAEAVFHVADRGPGIPEAERPHVTERFFRGGNSGRTSGSGLGLAIVAAAMERMGGDFAIRPRPGGGELAELRLPADFPAS